MPTLAQTLVTELEKLFEPLADAAKAGEEGERAREDLFEALGVELTEAQMDRVANALSSFEQQYDQLSSLLDGGEGSESLTTLLKLLGATADLFAAIDDLATALDDVDAPNLVADLIDYVSLVYLQSEYGGVYYAGVLLTLIEVESADPGSVQWFRDRRSLPQRSAAAANFDLDRLDSVLQQPIEELKETYLPDGPITDEELEQIEARLMPWLEALAGRLGFLVASRAATSDLADQLGTPGLTITSPITFLRPIAGGTGRVSVTIALAHGADGLAVVVIPRGQANLAVTADPIAFKFSLTGETGPMLLNADGMAPLASGSTEPEVNTTVEARKQPDPATGAAFVLGPGNGTRVEVGNLGFAGRLSASEDGLEGGIEGSATESAFVLDPSNPDGFVSKVLPEEGFSFEFDAGIGYGTNRGLYFVGGGGLDTDIPVAFSLGNVLSVNALHLAAKPAPSGTSTRIPVQLSTSPQVQLGPVGATIERIGLAADLTFPDERDGNLGPVQVDLGFKPPSGAGLSVDASAVVGGGYLSFDPENERYSGTLQLQIGALSLKAIGLLTTRLPDGRDGFSLLVIITGEFPPMQLGFGFTLNGLGGLLGVNRDTKVDVLRSGLRDGTTKSVLFPKDPMRNAPRIVSDLRSVFPPTGGRHVFGPMARLGWGTPTIMTADIGVLISLPSPVKLVILGRLHAALPDDDAALVVFNMDAIGAIDFGAQEGSIDATLYDSRVVAYTLTGDMAMRTNWGEDPDFALSVGGFHPRFDPPEGFPPLRRIALTLGPGNPRIRWSGYFAITSNTVQAGAKVELYAGAGKFSVSGHLGFDALFQFDPFKLLVDISAGFAIKLGGATLLSATLKGSLEGPSPWHVRGKVKFKIWPISFKVSVDATFGERSDPEPLPPADVLGKVVGELGKAGNWSAQLPEGGNSVVTLREIEKQAGTVLAHPLGTLQVRQQVSPLNVAIEKFGNARPATYTKYTIESVTVAGQPQQGEDSAVREQFAPAQFFEMSDEEKLSGPSFERYPAGRTVGNTLFAHGGQDDATNQRSVTLDYETTIVDRTESAFPIAWVRLAMPHATAQALVSVSAVALGPLRTTGDERFAGTDDASGPIGVDASVTVTDTTYVVARSGDLRRVAVEAVSDGGTTKREAEEALNDVRASSDDEEYRVVATHEASGPEVQP